MATFYMPTRVFEEENAVKHHRDDMAALGQKALIVTGRHSAVSCGAYDDITEALDACGVAHCVFNQVEENPSTETIMLARNFGLAEGADFVIGVGGGSPLDASKAIALMMAHPFEGIGYLYGGKDAAALPVVAIPTTCGTGSEVTPVSVLTIKEKQTKKSIPFKLFPKLALIDGKYVKNAPRSIVCNTAFDALTHLYESYINVKATDYSRMCVDAGLKAWAKCQSVIRGEKDPDDAGLLTMMRASAFAGMAIAQTATTVPHGLSYPVTTKLGVPHGKATAYFTAGYLAEADAVDREYLLSSAGFASIDDFREVYHRACGPIDADADTLNAVLEGAAQELAANTAKTAAVPYNVNAEVIRNITFYEIEH